VDGSPEDFSFPFIFGIFLQGQMLKNGRQKELEVFSVGPGFTFGYQKHFCEGRVLLCRRSDTRCILANRRGCSTPVCFIIWDIVTDISAEYSTLSMQYTIPLQMSWFFLRHLYIIGQMFEQVY
jgi:hypothetical protein